MKLNNGNNKKNRTFNCTTWEGTEIIFVLHFILICYTIVCCCFSYELFMQNYNHAYNLNDILCTLDFIEVVLR